MKNFWQIYGTVIVALRLLTPISLYYTPVLAYLMVINEIPHVLYVLYRASKLTMLFDSVVNDVFRCSLFRAVFYVIAIQGGEPYRWIAWLIAVIDLLLMGGHFLQVHFLACPICSKPRIVVCLSCGELHCQHCENPHSLQHPPVNPP